MKEERRRKNGEAGLVFTYAQAVAPAAEFLLVEHKEQVDDEVAPTAVEYRPETQFVQADEPEVAPYFPGRQFMQADEPVAD